MRQRSPGGIDATAAPGSSQVIMSGLRENVAVILMIGMLICVLLCALAWNAATRSAERAFSAQQSAAINREYAVQVVGQLNRMGFPVISPGEKDHPPALPEDYARLAAFAEQKLKEQESDGHH